MQYCTMRLLFLDLKYRMGVGYICTPIVPDLETRLVAFGLSNPDRPGPTYKAA